MQFILFLMLLAVHTLSLRKVKCRLLAFEGGGTKGAFQSGAFKAMVEILKPEELKYDVIAGVSVGSINGMLLAATPMGKEKEAAKKLSKLWATIESNDVMADFSYLDIIRGFFDKQSFLSNAPLHNYLSENLKQLGGKLYRRYTVGTVDAYTARTVIISDGMKGAEIPKSVVASAAIPGLFPYSIYRNRTLIDGGVIDNVNLRGGIEQCKQLVNDDSSITIDVIMTNPINTQTTRDMRDASSYTIYSRGKEIAGEASNFWYLRDAITAFPSANWRYLIAPKEALPNYPVIALSFDRETLRIEEEIGYNVTMDILRTEKANFQKVITKGPRIIRRRIQ